VEKASPNVALVGSSFGTLAVVGQNTLIIRVLLPDKPDRIRAELHSLFPGITEASSGPLLRLGRDLTRFLSGQAVEFSTDNLDWSQCSEFQRRVLLLEHAIPRGRISTYGRIAAHMGKPDAARAVGSALARNPFPLIIPCHRALAADLSLGGYQGGLATKRRLLEFEGIHFAASGRALADPYY
jgi:methylated-DNA-[protein]-cysteine S-methyltransferase